MSIQQNMASDIYRMADSVHRSKDIAAFQQSLAQSIKSGAVESYVGIPVLQSLTQKLKLAQQKEAMAMAAPQDQQQQGVPIAAQVMQDADQYRGIDELPTNLPTEEDERAVNDEYANGGIIAFAEPTAQNNNSRVTDPDVDVLERMRIEDPEGYKRLMGGNTISPEFGGSSITPEQDAERVAKIKEDLGYDPSTVYDFLSSPPKTAASPTRGSLTAGISPADVARTEAQLPKGITALVGSEKLTPRVGLENAPSTLAQAEALAGKSPAAAQAVSAVDRYMAMLEKSGESVGREKKEALYMALIQGGLGMMGGTSPNAFANISAGLLPATQAYQQAIAGIRKDDRARIEKLINAGLSKEKLGMELKKLGIEEKKVDALVNFYNAKAGAAGSGGSAAADKLSLLEQKQLEAMELKARQEVRTATTAMNKDLANNTTYQMNLRLANTSKDPKQRAEALATVNSIKQPYLDLISDAREYANVYSTRRRGTTGETDSSGGPALPKGIPTGSRLAGKSGGKDVYEAPDGKRYIVD